MTVYDQHTSLSNLEVGQQERANLSRHDDMPMESMCDQGANLILRSGYSICCEMKVYVVRMHTM